MIKIKNIGKYMALAGCLAFASCSKDDDNVPSVSFPELQTIECEVNSTADISFESTGNWKLSSSSLWCQFVVDGERMHSCQGKAGKQTVKLMVTDDAIELMKSYTADITLEIDGQEKVIYKVSRPMVGYELHVMDVAQENEFSAGNPVTVTYSGAVNFKVSANCTWALVSKPEWVSVKSSVFSDDNYSSSVCGTEKEVVTASTEIVQTYRFLPREGELVFKSEDGQKSVTVPVVYGGMPEDEIEFSLASNNRFNWTFSADGFTLSSGSDMGSSTTIDAPMSIGVWAKDQKYEFVLLTKDDYGYMQMDASRAWYYVENLKDSETENHIEISVQGNTGIARQGCVMAFPKTVYDQIISNFDAIIFENEYMDIKYEYTKYVAFEFKQASPEGGSTGFSFLDEGGSQIPLGDNYMSYAAMTGATDEELIGMYGTSNVWMFMPERPYEMLNIIPAGAGDWCYGFDTYLNGVDTTISGVTLEADYRGGAKPSFCMYGLSSNGNMTITFMDNNGTPYAVLIIEAWFE